MNSLYGEPGQRRKLDHIIGAQSESDADHEQCEGDVEAEAHPEVHFDETALYYPDEGDK